MSSSVRFWARAVEHAGSALLGALGSTISGIVPSGLEFFDWLAAPVPPPPLVLFLSSGCLLSFCCPRLGVAGRTLERSVSALSTPLGSVLWQASQAVHGVRQRSPCVLGECPYLRMRAPARSVYLLAARSGRAPQVFGGASNYRCALERAGCAI